MSNTERTVARLIDVARKAGVSRSTASNVFNAPDMVRPELRERVLAAARSLDYLGPDPKARVLRSGKFNAIGVMAPAQWGVTDSLRNPVYGRFLLGVARACDEAGASLTVVPDDPGAGGIRSSLVDGFIFGRAEHLDLLRLAQLRKIPLVVVDFDPGHDINSVRVDSRAGCYAAARHLVDLGHRNFAILSFLRGPGAARLHVAGRPRDPGAAGMHTDQEKLHGFADALGEAGIDIDDVPMVQADPWDPDAARLILDAAPEATAILSMSVMQAISVLQEAARRGMSVPRDLSVIGYNDIEAAANAAPPLTTVDALGVEKGYRAARMVFENAAGRHEILKPRLVIRQSTGPAPAGEGL